MELTRPGSSPIDWCETNYAVSSNIAEFFNTISNFLFFIVPPLTVILFRDFGTLITRGIHIIWFMLVVVGLGSVYFHSTLSMAGQLMDELSILWVLMTSYTVLFPDKYLSLYLQENRCIWYSGFFSTTLFITFLCFLKPSLNAYFLMLFAIPVITMLTIMVKDSSPVIIRLGKRIIFTWFLAVSCWIADKIFCDFWVRLNIPYFHSIFHVLIFLASHSSIVLFAYFTADYRVPNLKPVITYWPSSMKYEFLSIPYIEFRYLKKQDKKPGLIVPVSEPKHS